MLANFVDHFERFGCCSMKCKHGTIVGLHVDSSKCRALSKYSIICIITFMLFPCLEYFCLNDIPVVDVTHFVPLFSSVHKLVSLKVFAITIEGDEGGLPAVTIPPQHCPSLSVVANQQVEQAHFYSNL